MNLYLRDFFFHLLYSEHGSIQILNSISSNTMGRKAISKEDIKTKRQERNQKYLSNHDALTRTRESNRLKMQERRRRERLTSLDPHALLADTAIQAEMRDVNEEEERRCSDHDDGDGDGDGDDNDDAFDRPTS
jgi:hypothetical protein